MYNRFSFENKKHPDWIRFPKAIVPACVPLYRKRWVEYFSYGGKQSQTSRREAEIEKGKKIEREFLVTRRVHGNKCAGTDNAKES